MTKRKSTPASSVTRSASKRHPGKHPGTPRGGDQRTWSCRLLLFSTLFGGFFVGATMFLGPRNPFGPAKSLTMGLAALGVLAALAIEGTLLALATDVLRRSRVAWATGALLALSVLSAALALDPRRALLGGYPDYRGVISMCCYAVLALGAAVVWDRERSLRPFGRAAVLSGLLIAAVGMAQFVGIVPSGSTGSSTSLMRLSSTLGNASNLGVFLVFILPLVIQRAFAEERLRWRIPAIAVTALSAGGLVMTFSRGGWIAAIVMIGAWALLVGLSRKSGRALMNARVLLAGAAALVLLVSVLVLVPSVTQRASTLLDTGSRTAKLRLSAWKSSGHMVAAKPFLGWGPDNFRFAYPRYQEPGQIDGRYGYQSFEAAHNLEFDTATSLGLPGLVALVAVVVFAVQALWRDIRVETGTDSAALAISLLGGLVALQFHYVTMDTGVLAGVLVGTVAGLEAVQRRGVEAHANVPAWARAVPGVLGAMALLIVIAGVLVIQADTAAARAIGLAKRGAPWSFVRVYAAQAASLAPWEPQLARVAGAAATVRVTKLYDEQAVRDGAASLARAASGARYDNAIRSERANLLLAAGITSRDPSLLQQAVAEFDKAAALDPATGIAISGKGAALLALGRTDEAISALEAGLKLSPRDQMAWRNISRAYELAGRNEDARLARTRLLGRPPR